MSEVQDATDALCDAIDVALEDSKLSAAEAVDLARKQFYSLHKAIRATGEDSEGRKAEWVVASRKVYDRSIAPLDIPGVGNVIERLFVDPAIGKFVPAGVSFVFDLAEDGVEWVYSMIERIATDLFKSAKGD